MEQTNKQINKDEIKGKNYAVLGLVIGILVIIFFSYIFLFLSQRGLHRSPFTIESNMADIRAQAVIYYNENSNSYAGVCSALNTTQKHGVKNYLEKVVAITAVKTTLNTDINIAGSPKYVTCHDTTTAWAAEAPLTGTTSDHSFSMFCVDSTGIAKVTNNNLVSNDTTCLE
jgi:hypothetical protein